MANMANVVQRKLGIRWWMASPALLLVAVIGLVIGVAVIAVMSLPSNNAALAEASPTGGGCGSAAVATDSSGGASPATGTSATIVLTGSSGVPPPPTTATTASGTAGSEAPASSVGTDPSDLAGVQLTAAQVQNAQVIVSVGKGLKVDSKEMSVALAVALISSKLDPAASVANGLGQGLFLQTSAAFPGVVRTDASASAAAFFPYMIKYERSGPYQAGLSFADLAEAMSIQGVGAFTAADYAHVQGWAQAMATVLTSGISGTGSGTFIDCGGGAADNVAWDPGNIISDAVFYNATAMSAAQIRSFIAVQDAGCAAANAWCLKNLKISDPGQPANTYCGAVTGGTNEDAATLIAAYSRSCGVNPQVMLTKLQLESQGLNRANPDASSYDAAWGWNCPDSGPGGSAHCDPAHAGFLHQLTGMARSWAQMKVDIPAHKYNYAVGTYNILWNVEETGCGAAPVNIKNLATASLYVYTPYQPNAASIQAYPGTGNKCSSYGNRNFFYQFRQYFGSTGGGTAIAGPAGGTVGGPIIVNGVTITLPASAGITGVITAPNTAVAKAISAALSWIGTPYSWGGGSPAGPTLGICGPDGAENDCHVVGFDCSGLMQYMWAQVGVSVDHFSQDIFTAGQQIPWSQKEAGDMIGYSGHIAMYVGTFGGTDYMLEAPESGELVHITPVRDHASEPHYATVSRVWAGAK
jgi:cell wall-associated NlpC family hydrolase